MDLLKTLDNRKYNRGERFKTLGLVNQPGFHAATKPDEYGLWLDEPTEPEPAGIDEKIYGKPPVFSVSGCSRIRSSTKPLARDGTGSAS